MTHRTEAITGNFADPDPDDSAAQARVGGRDGDGAGRPGSERTTRRQLACGGEVERFAR